LKPVCTGNTQFRIQGLREMLGGHGYSRFSMMGDWRNNNDINVTWEGDNTVLIQQASRFIMKNLEKKMKGKEVKFKCLSFLKNFEGTTSAKLNLESSKDLYDLNHINSLMEFRVNILLTKSVGRLAEKVANKVKPFDAWNDSQTFYLQTMAKAFGELHAFNCFRAKLDNLTESPTKKVMTEFLILFALVQLERDMVYLRENDFISTESCDLIRNEILELNNNLKDHVVTICDAISIPDEILGSPLGHSDGKVNFIYF
jgi:acyl-CoA oxidase